MNLTQHIDLTRQNVNSKNLDGDNIIQKNTLVYSDANTVYRREIIKIF